MLEYVPAPAAALAELGLGQVQEAEGDEHHNLLQPTLAAVVITASLSLADIPGTVRLWRQRRTELTLSMAAFAGVALLGVLPGIAIAVALSIGNVFRRAWWPHQTVLGQAPGVPGYRDLDSHPDVEQLPGCVLFRFDAPLFFANARTFRDQVRRLARSQSTPRWIVVAAEPITDVDTTAAELWARPWPRSRTSSGPAGSPPPANRPDDRGRPPGSSAEPVNQQAVTQAPVAHRQRLLS